MQVLAMYRAIRLMQITEALKTEALKTETPKTETPKIEALKWDAFKAGLERKPVAIR